MKYLFHHIPKCAGTAFVQNAKKQAKYKILRFCGPNVIQEWGGNPEKLKKEEWKSFLLPFPGFRNAPHDYTTSLDLAKDCDGHEDIILYSHQFYGEVDDLMGDGSWKKIISLRHPFSRFFSLVLQKQKIQTDYFAAEDFLAFNFFYKEWCRGSAPLELNKQNAQHILTEAKYNLDLFDVLILQENLQQDFSRLIKPNCLLIKENRSHHSEEIKIPHKLLKWFEQYIEYDIEFYQYALNKFNINPKP